MLFISDKILKKRTILNNLKVENAHNFYILNLKQKIFGFLHSNFDINLKLQRYFINSITIKKKKHILIKLYKKIKEFLKYSKIKEKQVRDKIQLIIKNIFTKKLLKGLQILKQDSNDMKLKQNLIKKLKEKANYLIGNN